MNLRKVLHIISMTDPKYLPMMGLPMLVPYLAGGPASFWMLFGGALGTVVLNMAAVMVNTYSDRQADAVNFPSGVKANESFIGYRRMLFWIAGLYALLLLATGIMWVSISKQVSVIYTAGWIVATIYSVGPRLKQYLLTSRLCIACGPSFAFAGGWALRHDLRQLPAATLLLFVGQGLHILLKDVPDEDGDRKAGIRTLFTGVPRARLRILLPALWTLPYALILVGALLEWWSQRYLLLWVLYPLSMLTVTSPFRVSTQRDKELVRELAQLYSTFYVLGNLLLFSLTPVVLWLCGGAIVFYLVVLSLGIDRRKQGHGLVALLSFIGRLASPRGPAQAALSVPRDP